MAIDNTPPRLRLIITIAFFVIVTLFSLNFVFESYYAYMADDAYRSKLAPTTDRDEHHKAENASLTAANVDKAMLSLQQGRTEAISPAQSDDKGPLTGWTKMPKTLDEPAGHETHPVADGGGAHATDAGTLATDAGVHGDAGATDGGKPAPKADGGAAPHTAPKDAGH